MLLMIDEGLTPVFGYSAPNRDNPLLTQARGSPGTFSLAPSTRW